MKYVPKRIKYKKYFQNKFSGVSVKNNQLPQSKFGIKALSGGLITGEQLEAARRVVTRGLNRKGKLSIRIVTDKPITLKLIGACMGKGKGAVDYWVAQIKPGQVLIELDGVSKTQAKLVLLNAGKKLPIKVFFTEREESLFELAFHSDA
jgi:large subunit ribosomal protein L16